MKNLPYEDIYAIVEGMSLSPHDKANLLSIIDEEDEDRDAFVTYA